MLDAGMCVRRRLGQVFDIERRRKGNCATHIDFNENPVLMSHVEFYFC